MGDREGERGRGRKDKVENGKGEEMRKGIMGKWEESGSRKKGDGGGGKEGKMGEGKEG